MSKDVATRMLYCLDLICLDTMATLIQEGKQQENASSEQSVNQTTIASRASVAKETDNGVSGVSNGTDASEMNKSKADDPNEQRGRSNSVRLLAGAPRKTSTGPGTSTKVHSPGLTVKDYPKICPILAALSKEIETFFKETPLVLEELQKETSPSSSAPSSFILFQKECSKFAADSLGEGVVSEFTETQKVSWREIASLIRIIIDYPNTPLDIEPSQSLGNLIDVTDRILNSAPRYSNQTAEMSAKGKIMLTHAEIFDFMEKMVRHNSAYEQQRAQTSNKGTETLEKLFDISNNRMESQSYHMTKSKEDQIRAGVFVEMAQQGEKLRLTDQDWVSPRIQKEEVLEKIGAKAGKANPALQEQQRFTPSADKEKEMYMAKVAGALERAPRLAGQESLTKKELMDSRIENVFVSLEKAPKRLDTQSAEFPKSRRNTIESPKAVDNASAEKPQGRVSLSFRASFTKSNDTKDRTSVTEGGRPSLTPSINNTQGRRKSSITGMVKNLARRASLAFRNEPEPQHIQEEATDSSTAPLKEESDTYSKSSEVLSLGEMLNSPPKKLEKAPTADPIRTKSQEENSPKLKASSKSTEQINVFGAVKTFLKGSKGDPSIPEPQPLAEKSVKRSLTGSAGSIKALYNTITGKRSSTTTSDESEDKKGGGKAKSKSNLATSTSANSLPKTTGAAAEVINVKNSPEESVLQGKETALEELPVLPQSRVSEIRQPAILPLQTRGSTDTVELKAALEEKDSLLPLGSSTTNPTHIQEESSISATNPTVKRRESKLRTSINPEELERLADEQEPGKSIGRTPSKRTSRVSPSKEVGAKMTIKTLNSSGCTLPDNDLRKERQEVTDALLNDHVVEDSLAPLVVTSAPATRGPTHAKEPSVISHKVHADIFGAQSESLESTKSY